MRASLATVAALTLLGCQDVTTIRDREGGDLWEQTPTDQVDILWVIDNSNSMQLEQEILSRGFGDFAAELEATNTDFHLGVITTDFDYTNPDRGKLISEPGRPGVITADDPYDTWFTERVLVGLNGSGKEKGLEAAEYALSPEMTTGPNAGFLREEANLLVVFVSDEDDCSDEGALDGLDNVACYNTRERLVPVEQYVEEFQGLKRSKDQVQVGAIVGPEDASALCDDTTLPGRRYIDMARLTGGLTGSICQTDWSSFLFDLGLNATGIFTTFELSHGAKEGTLEVFVDGSPVPEDEFDGYTYDAEAFTITFHGSYIPPRGATIEANYVIEPGT